MESLSNPLFIIPFASGICIWIVCSLTLRYPPKKISKTYGYRTARSMKSQEAWEYAQIHGTTKMRRAAQTLCFFSLIGLVIDAEYVLASFIGIFATLAALMIPLAMTEKELKDKFPS